jgi:hypothetical protein
MGVVPQDGDIMKHEAHAATPNPFDVRALFDATPGAAAFGGDAMRAWIDSATRMQAEATAFWTGRAGKDVAAMNALVRCTSPTEAMQAQMAYAKEAVADFYAEGQRMMRVVTDVTRLGMTAPAQDE